MQQGASNTNKHGRAKAKCGCREVRACRRRHVRRDPRLDMLYQSMKEGISAMCKTVPASGQHSGADERAGLAFAWPAHKPHARACSAAEKPGTPGARRWGAKGYQGLEVACRMRDAFFRMRHAAMEAPKPESMFTTQTPGAEELRAASMGATPLKDAP